MIIRPYLATDYDSVVQLLNDCNIEPPVEPGDLNGLGLVAEESDRVIGFMWALVSTSTFAHVDYLAVSDDYQGSKIASSMIVIMDKLLISMGVRRYEFHVEQHSDRFLGLIEKYKGPSKIQKLRPLHIFRREIL